MKFSVCATFSGIACDTKYYPSDVTYDDVRRDLRSLNIEFTETEDGDSEYLYCAKEQIGNLNAFLADVCLRVSAAHDVPLPSEDDSGYGWQIEFLRLHCDNDDLQGLSFWERFAIRGRDMTVNCVLDKSQFSRFVDAIGAVANDCNTLGTLGGPLGGIVPDVDFRIESSALIASFRATPFFSRFALNECDSEERAERIWARLRAATIAVYG